MQNPNILIGLPYIVNRWRPTLLNISVVAKFSQDYHNLQEKNMQIKDREKSYGKSTFLNSRLKVVRAYVTHVTVLVT